MDEEKIKVGSFYSLTPFGKELAEITLKYCEDVKKLIRKYSKSTSE